MTSLYEMAQQAKMDKQQAEALKAFILLEKFESILSRAALRGETSWSTDIYIASKHGLCTEADIPGKFVRTCLQHVNLGTVEVRYDHLTRMLSFEFLPNPTEPHRGHE